MESTKKAIGEGGKGMSLKFYPTIGLQTSGENVKINFGQDDFKFDIVSFVRVSTIISDDPEASVDKRFYSLPTPTVSDNQRRKQELTDLVYSSPIPRSLLQALSPLPASSILFGNDAFHSASSSFESASTSKASTDGAEQHLRLAMAQLVAGYLSHQGTVTLLAYENGES